MRSFWRVLSRNEKGLTKNAENRSALADAPYKVCNHFVLLELAVTLEMERKTSNTMMRFYK